MRISQGVGVALVALAALVMAVLAPEPALGRPHRRPRTGIRAVDFANRTYATSRGTIRLVRGREPGRRGDDRAELSGVTYGTLGANREVALVVLTKTNDNVAQDDGYYYLVGLAAGKPVVLWRGEGGRGEETYGVQAAALLSRTLIVDEDVDGEVPDGPCELRDLARKTYWLVGGTVALHSTVKLVFCPRPARAPASRRAPAAPPTPARRR
jgi:hypothetical protein